MPIQTAKTEVRLLQVSAILSEMGGVMEMNTVQQNKCFVVLFCVCW